MKQKINLFTKILIASVAIVAFFSSCSTNNAELKEKIKSLESELKGFKEEKAMTEKRLSEFDLLDFDYYTNQNWDKFKDSHAEGIKVFYPDGSVTEGLYPAHIDALTPMFKFAPDTRIETHPVSFGSGDWTAVIGIIEGTFSEPMPIGNGKTIPPTGKSFKLQMATIGKWNGDKMVEEYLFWDNQSFMKQIGLAN